MLSNSSLTYNRLKLQTELYFPLLAGVRISLQPNVFQKLYNRPCYRGVVLRCHDISNQNVLAHGMRVINQQRFFFRLKFLIEGFRALRINRFVEV